MSWVHGGLSLIWTWLLPAVSSSVVELEQEAAQGRGLSLCQALCVCPGVCVWAGWWSPPLAVCWCYTDRRPEASDRTWPGTERRRMNKTGGTDGLTTDSSRERERFSLQGSVLVRAFETVKFHHVGSRSVELEWETWWGKDHGWGGRDRCTQKKTLKYSGRNWCYQSQTWSNWVWSEHIHERKWYDSVSLPLPEDVIISDVPPK